MNCCCLLLNISSPSFLKTEFQLFLQYQLDGQGNCYYEFELNGDITYIRWIPDDGGQWILEDKSTNTVYYYFPSENVCPVSTLEDWEPTEAAFPITYLYISATACENPEIDIPTIEVPNPNCNEPIPCKYINLLKKQKAALALDVAANKPYEVLGLKGCEENWNNLLMRHLIIDALKCVPQGVYSEATENCLINKLTETCNC